MFTIKYRLYQLSPEQPDRGPTQYDEIEQVFGGFGFVSKEMEDGWPVVNAHGAHGSPAMTFRTMNPENDRTMPRPKLWVMNEAGATVATYDL